ncbi:MAG: ABC transporter ATP-binding protein [Bacteroidota bacterium]
MALLTVLDLWVKEGGMYTVKNMSFTQAPMQKIAIAGETGSGKTTLLKAIAGLVQPHSGEIFFDQQKLRGPNEQLVPGHAGIAYLSQHFELRNNYGVHEILSYANEQPQHEAELLYKICRIDHLLNRRTHQLSGGEKQRIALARLLVGEPRLLLLDEPFSNLDAAHRAIIKTVITDITAKLGISCIMVSHDAADLLSWADTLYLIKNGEIIQTGTPEQVYRQPMNEYGAALFGDYNLVNHQNAAVLNPSGELISAGKQMLVRPAEIALSNSGPGLQARVQDSLFMGSYYMIQVVAGEELIKVSAGSNCFSPGEMVWISLAHPNPWFL